MSIHAFTLVCSVNYGEFLEQELKRTLSDYMSLVYCVMFSFSKELEDPLLSPLFRGRIGVWIMNYFVLFACVLGSRRVSQRSAIIILSLSM